MIYETVLSFFSLLLCATGAALLYRSGIVHTGIIGQMVLTAITYGYAAQYGIIFGVAISFLVSLAIILIAIAARIFNSRTYIVFLYCFSLASIGIGNFIMTDVWPSAKGAVRTPTIEWPFNRDVTLGLSAAFTLIALYFLAQLACSWRGVLLAHWRVLPARTLRDVYLSGTFAPKRLAGALYPVATLSAALFVLSVLLGRFALYNSYSSSEFDVIPFTALLFALLSSRPFRLTLLVFLYCALALAARSVANGAGQDIPVMATYIFYGAAFFIFSWYADRT